MQQPSVANYFRIKKRIRDEPTNNKGSKIVAMSPEIPGGVDMPKPIRVFGSGSTPILPERACLSSQTQCTDTETERKTAKGKRHTPCYQKYHHLVSTAEPQDQDVDMAPDSTNESSTSSSPITSSGFNLAVPFKDKMLFEHFRAVETVVSIFFNRNEIITFNKVKPAVLQLSRSTQLREKHLAQFLTVFPNCYTLSYEKITAPESKEAQYQLVMTPNLALSSIRADGKMTSALIAERQAIFQEGLLERCHQYHKEFLASLNPPLVLPSDSQVTRWHPKFALNEIPSIVPGSMPKCPDTLSAVTAKEVIARARDIMEAANPRMRVALQELMRKTVGTNVARLAPAAESPLAEIKPAQDPAEKRSATKDSILKAQQALLRRAKGNPAALAALNKVLVKNNKEPIPEPGQRSSSTAIPEGARLSEDPKRGLLTPKTLTALKGVSQSLIDKIRAREQEKAIRAMTLSPRDAKDQAMLNRLPEFVRIVRNTMVAEKKSVLALQLVVERIFHSNFQALSHTEVEGHLRLLHKTVPGWITILKTSQGDYVKINKELNINEIVDQIQGTIGKGK